MYLKKFGDSLSFEFSSKKESKKARLKLIKNVVQSFGPIVNSLKITSIDGKQATKRNEDEILQAANKYFACNENDDRLKTLVLEAFHFMPSSVPICQSLFNRIDKLELLEIKMYDGAKAAFENCSNLTDLKIYRSATNPVVSFTLDKIRYGRKSWSRWVDDENVRDACIDHNFPQLKTVLLDRVGTLQSADIRNFVLKNPQLRKLNISGCYSLHEDTIRAALNELNRKELKVTIKNR